MLKKYMNILGYNCLQLVSYVFGIVLCISIFTNFQTISTNLYGTNTHLSHTPAVAYCPLFEWCLPAAPFTIIPFLFATKVDASIETLFQTSQLRS